MYLGTASLLIYESGIVVRSRAQLFSAAAYSAVAEEESRLSNSVTCSLLTTVSVQHMKHTMPKVVTA